MMNVALDTPVNPRFQKFQEILAETLKDPAQAARYNAQVTNPATLMTFFAERGLLLRQSEADGIFGVGEEAATRLETLRQSGELNDAELEALSGGLSWLKVGAAAGIMVGLVVGGASAPALAGGAVALQGLQFFGLAAASTGAGATAGGAVGAVFGYAAEKICDLFN